MKKTLTILSVALLALVFSSCVESSKKYKALLAEKENLVAENKNIENEYNAALGIINEVENNLQAIRDAESLMMMNVEGSQREKLTAEPLQIKEEMAANRAKLDSLSDALQKSNRNVANLRSTIKKLQAQLEEKEQMIASLQEQIAEKDVQIAGLNTQVTDLNENLNEMNSKHEDALRQINEQITEMNTVYYIGSSKKELKNNGILTKKYVLRKDVPTNLFTKADKRDLDKITFEAKKITVLSSHPENSYNIVVDAGVATINITNPDLFWSVTKYLVVVTK